MIYHVAGELLNSLRNTLTYFAASRPPQQQVRSIVLTGGGALLIGFADALTESTRIPVTFGNPLEALSVRRNFAADTSTVDSATVAIGLALGSAA